MKRLPETDKLERRLESIGRAIQSQFSKRGFGTFLFGLCVGLWSLFVIDYLTHIPYVIRIGICVVGLLYGLYYLNREYLSKARVKLSAEEVSLKVEGQHPELQSRLISMLQFQSTKRLPEGVSENLVDGLVDQAHDRVHDINLNTVIDHSWFKKHFKRITLMLLLITGTTLLAPNYVLAYLQRFIDPEARYPTRTQITDVSVDKVIPAGDPFDVTVNAAGVLPEMGTVVITTASAGDVEFELTPGEKPGQYTGNIGAITEDAEFSVYLGDDRYGPTDVVPTPRPFLKSIAITVDSPSYTGIEQQVEKTGNIRVIKGSALLFNIEANKPLESIELRTRTEDIDLPVLESSDNIHWTMKLDAEQSFSYQLIMKDQEGLESVDNANYQVSVMRDRPPVIRIETPKGVSELASVSKMFLRFKVNDDIGVDNVKVNYVVMKSTGDDSFVEIDYNSASTLFEFNDINSKSFEFDDVWDNSKISSLNTGDTVYLWVEASDKSPEQHLTRSTDRQILVISFDEYRNKLLQRLSDNVDKVEDPIIDLKDSARKLEDD